MSVFHAVKNNSFLKMFNFIFSHDHGQTCSVKDPNTGFEFNLQSLAIKEGYTVTADGKDFVV